jgi:dihydrofolate synthase / folylpolyglutamate synthase
VDYSSALCALYEIGAGGIHLGLDRVRRIAGRLGDPQSGLRCVQVAGTNGKGIVATALARGAQAAGLRVGLFTSPHLHRFAERIRIDGECVDEEGLADSLSRVMRAASGPSGSALTFFETATLAALLVFAERRVDLAVLEVGLGGRLDATSIAEPNVAVIVSVGLDHTELLGETVREIAREKAAIARPGCPLIVGRLCPEALAAVEETARDVRAELRVLGRDFEHPGITAPLPGDHQRDNAAIALEAFLALAREDPRLDRGAFLSGLAGLSWPGRFEVILSEQRFLLDGAHNTAAIEALIAALEEARIVPAVTLFGALEGKRAEVSLDRLRSLGGRVVLAPPPIARAAAPARLARGSDEVVPSVEEGLVRCRELAGEGAWVLVTGSLFTVAAARAALLEVEVDPPIGL